VRLYWKLSLMIAVFAWAATARVQAFINARCFEAGLALVGACGSTAEYQAMMDARQRQLAEECDSLDGYFAMKEFDRLLAERLADAARMGIALSKDDIARLSDECLHEAFGRPPAPPGENADPGADLPQAEALAVSHPSGQLD
jgi:hypothetical protein